jgi:hypothetical protein
LPIKGAAALIARDIAVLDETLVVRPFLAPLLDGTADGMWDPHAAARSMRPGGRGATAANDGR